MRMSYNIGGSHGLYCICKFYCRVCLIYLIPVIGLVLWNSLDREFVDYMSGMIMK